MTEHINYAATNLIGTEMVDRSTEVRDVVADLQRFGAIAIASEIEAGMVTGNPPISTELTSPLVGKDLKRQFLIDLTADTARNAVSRGVKSYATDASRAINEVNRELTLFSDSGATPDAVRSYILSNTRQIRQEQSLVRMGNTDMIMADSLPPFFANLNPEGSWSQWVANAKDEQLVNFSQWYTERLKLLVNPARRGELTKQLEDDFATKVRGAMNAGWINPRHKKQLGHALSHQKVFYFSPFGRIAKSEFAGARQDVTISRSDVVALPTTASPGSWVSTHEFGHGFAGVGTKTLAKSFAEVVGKNTIKEHPQVLAGLASLYVILNEGFNDHMTAALIEGSPTTIDPVDREKIGIARDPATSELYETYRAAFAALVAGDDSAPTLTNSDFSRLVDTMVEGNFRLFSSFVRERWSGRDVMGEILTKVGKVFAEIPTKTNDVDSINNVIGVMKEVLMGEKFEPVRSFSSPSRVQHAISLSSVSRVA